MNRAPHELAAQIVSDINDAEQQQEEAEDIPASDLWELLRRIRVMARAIRDMTRPK